MPLQHLIDYFNQRFVEQNGLKEPPLRYEGGRVTGRFDGSDFTTRLRPVRQGSAPIVVTGYDAATQVDWPEPGTAFGDNVPDIVSLDRLARTVHMLNFLPISHEDGHLFVHVHPRHVLAVKQDHGAYFEEIIVKCGLQTQHVAIGLTLEQVHARFFPAFLKGLHNYQRRGYRLALKFNGYALEKPVFELIEKIAPDFVGISAQGLEQIQDASTFGKIQQLNSLTASIEARSLLLHVEDKFQAELARKAGFNLVQGDYFEQAITSVNRPDTRLSSASRMSNAHW